MINIEEFENKFKHFKKAIDSLKEVLVTTQKIEKQDEKLFGMLRDSSIQRFEYTFELSWKTMRYLLEKYDNEIEVRSPKQCLKTAFRVGYIDDLEKWFKISDYRNKTSHEYEENIANELYDNIGGFLSEIQKFYELIKIKIDGGYFK